MKRKRKTQPNLPKGGVVPGNIRMVVEEGEVDGSHSHLVVEVVVRSFEV